MSFAGGSPLCHSPGRTLSTFAPNFSNTCTFSIATSSGMMIQHSYPLAGELYQRDPIRFSCDSTDLALPTVASEIPVLPTVPSNRTDPVLGYSKPSFSASSMTADQRCPKASNRLLKATRSFGDPPGLRNCSSQLGILLKRSTDTDLAFPLFTCSAIYTWLSYRTHQYLNPESVAQRIYPNQRGIPFTHARKHMPPLEMKTLPIRPMTPLITSSLLTSIGLGGILEIALRRLHPCVRSASDVEDKETVIPSKRPMTRSRVNLEGRRKVSLRLRLSRRSRKPIVYGCKRSDRSN